MKSSISESAMRLVNAIRSGAASEEFSTWAGFMMVHIIEQGGVDQWVIDEADRLDVLPAPKDKDAGLVPWELSDRDARRVYSLDLERLHDGSPTCETYLGKLAEVRFSKLREALDSASKKVEEIVCTEGDDRGVVLLSNDGPCDWSEEHKCHVYRHVYFSPLGDALIALHDMLQESTTAPK